MRVKATMLGEYESKRVKPGEIIVLKDKKGKKLDPVTGKLVDHIFKAKDQFSSKWMEALDADLETDDESVDEPVSPKKKPMKKNKGLELDVI